VTKTKTKIKHLTKKHWYGDHDDCDKVSNVAAVALRVCKKLVTQQLSQLYTFARNVHSCERHIPVSVQDYSDCTTVHCCYISWRSGHVPRYSELSGCNVGRTEKLFATCLYSVYDWHWRCCAFGVTSCGFIDSTFALLLKIHLRFRGSFLRFHSMATVTCLGRWNAHIKLRNQRLFHTESDPHCTGCELNSASRCLLRCRMRFVWADWHWLMSEVKDFDHFRQRRDWDVSSKCKWTRQTGSGQISGNVLRRI